jgi:autotransporter-associated beta strand protein
LTTVTVSGSGDLTLTGTASTAITSVNAGSLTGDLTLDVQRPKQRT